MSPYCKLLSHTEVVGQADGHFLYYVSEDRTRISEIPLQNSALELVLFVRERSKIRFCR